MRPVYTLAWYEKLGWRDRLDFDDWLKAEGLTGELIRSFVLGEGHIVATCIVRPTRVVDDELVTEYRRLPVSSLPPLRPPLVEVA